MAEIAYITLKTSDGGSTRKKKFRVIAQDYDDGTYNRSESVRRTVGGGIDHSIGKPYRTWSPTIRVRYTESDTSYGTASDLEYFFNLNDPGATPSNVIQFSDNHYDGYNGTQYTALVHMVGQMPKMLMGCKIEGTEAWYMYKVTFMEE